MKASGRGSALFFRHRNLFAYILAAQGDGTNPQRRVVLDLGTVRNLAEVKINGHKAGLLWASPFQLEISDFLQPGTNRIEIAVTNLWVNRLIGDARNTATIPETDGSADWVLADKPNSGQGTYTFFALERLEQRGAVATFGADRR
ncbi:MAG: glycosylhydrolase-like jelly roll fold domain-containing protein [Alistipes indistinctus]